MSSKKISRQKLIEEINKTTDKLKGFEEKVDNLILESQRLENDPKTKEKASILRSQANEILNKVNKEKEKLAFLNQTLKEQEFNGPLLVIKGVTKVFAPGTVNEKVALEDINLTVNQGDVICVIGSNGSGKSTLFNMIAGTFPVTSGTIELAGKNITRLPEFKRSYEIGRVFQDPTKGTSANMSIEDNMMLASKKGMRGVSFSLNSKTRSYYKTLLRPIHLEERLKDNVGLLSGGQRQALTLLMTTLSKPHLMLLDEHTAALDPGNAEIVMDLTKEYIEKDNLTAMMVTHNMQFAIDYGNRLIMMDKGHIIMDISGDEKKKLTVPALVKRFKEISKTDFTNDEGLLTT